jgi:GNAT superfamily N-acetyltransferase
MDEAARVLERLERIDALGEAPARRGQLVGELRALVREAEAWARLEGDARAVSAVEKLREGAEGMS